MYRYLFKSSKKTFCDQSKSLFRVEYDTFGPINVPTDKYWAAQTQRSLQNFAIGTKEDKMPISVVRAMAIVKKSAAKVNYNDLTNFQ
jgi:fumarate hydratase class II